MVLPLRPQLAQVALAALCAGALAACDNIGGESGRGEARPVVAPPKLSRVEILPPTIDRSTLKRVEVRNPLSIAATQIDVHKQSDGIVDILWVIDNSGSMKDERARLGANFGRFLQELLVLKVDFHMGVISTDANDKGQLRGTPKIITNLTPDPQAAFKANSDFPDSRARWEQGLRMMEVALSPPLSSTGVNAGFLRANAALAVIVVSDEDDGSYGDAAHYARFLRSAKGKGNENLTSFSSIAGSTPNGCYSPGAQAFFGGLAEPGYRYDAVATKTGGVLASICDASFEQSLVQIAAALNTLRRVFPLSLKPDPATITVTVNGVIIAQDVVNGWQFRADTQSIAFLGNFVPPPGAQIQISYAISP